MHYLDLTEDVAVTAKVKEMAKKVRAHCAAVAVGLAQFGVCSQTTRSAFVPQCGVAPGFITLAATHVVSKFDTVPFAACLCLSGLILTDIVDHRWRSSICAWVRFRTSPTTASRFAFVPCISD